MANVVTERKDSGAEELTFIGRQLPSIRGISLWAVLVPLAVLPVTFLYPPTPDYLSLAIMFGLLWFYLHGWMMHYFILDSEKITVKRHNTPWLNKSIRLNSIDNICIIEEGKMPVSLKITLKNNKVKVYPAGTLSVTTWDSLRLALQERGVKVSTDL